MEEPEVSIDGIVSKKCTQHKFALKYVCVICDEELNPILTEEGQFQCSICEDKFKFIQDLLEHCHLKHLRISAEEHEPAVDKLEQVPEPIKPRKTRNESEMKVPKLRKSSTSKNKFVTKIKNKRMAKERSTTVVEKKKTKEPDSEQKTDTEELGEMITPIMITLDNSDLTEESVEIVDSFKTLKPKAKVGRTISEKTNKKNKTKISDALNVENTDLPEDSGQIVNKKTENLGHQKRSRGSAENKFECSVCSKRYRHLCDLNQHMKIHDESKVFTCSVCGKKFVRADQFERHTATHKIKKKNEGLEPKDQEEQKNWCRGSAENKFESSVCSIRYRHLCNLNQHMKIHDENKVFTCSVCGKKFVRADKFQKHIARHKKEKPENKNNCTVCNKYFGQRSSRIRHERAIHGLQFVKIEKQKNLNCTFCNKHFEHNRSRTRHERTKHGSESESFVCEICGKRFDFMFTLNLHKQIHSGEKPFSCSHCNRSFAKLHTMKEHEKTHDKERERRFQCENCGKKFHKKTHLKTHQKNHCDVKEDKKLNHKNTVEKALPWDPPDQIFSPVTSEFYSMPTTVVNMPSFTFTN